MAPGILALALLLAPSLAVAQMYKCVDERGVTAYSDKPCPGAKGGQVDIQGQPALSGKLQERKDDLKRQDADFKRRQIVRDREAEKERAALEKKRAALAQRCAAARREHTGLSVARRVVRVDAKGQVTYMEDDVREKRLAELSKQLSACP